MSRLRRFFRALGQALIFILRGVFILLLLVIPIPLAFNPRRVVLTPKRPADPTLVVKKEDER